MKKTRELLHVCKGKRYYDASLRKEAVSDANKRQKNCVSDLMFGWYTEKTDHRYRFLLAVLFGKFQFVNGASWPDDPVFPLPFFRPAAPAPCAS